MAFPTYLLSIFLEHIVLSLLGVLGGYTFLVVIYRTYFHPLASFRGPLLGKFSSFYTWNAVVKQNRTVNQYELLQKYGSPLRISTNELVFSDLKSWSDIYGQSSLPCLKDPAVYDAFSVTGARNIVNVTSRSVHARLRRLLSHSFAASSLLDSEPMVAIKVQEYIDTVYTRSEGEVVDIYQKTHEVYIDIVSHLSFGQSFDCISGQNPTTSHDVDSFFTIIPAASFFPWIRYLPSQYIRDGLRGVKRLEEFSRTHVTRYLSSPEVASDTKQRGAFLMNLARSEDTETGTKLTLDEIVENAVLFLVAGSGTTATTTLYFIWECGRRADVRERLVAEVRQQFPDPMVMPTYEEVSSLKYFNCVLEEVLRLWGPLSIGNPRVSPGKVLGKDFIPKGTVVSTNAYATARDPNVFSEPYEFKPDRWENATAAMKNMSRPFSFGPRNCIGRHLAELAMSLVLARLYQLYDVVTDPSTNEHQMRVKDKGALGPWGESVKVIATPVVRE